MADETLTIQRIIEIHAERSTDSVKDLKNEINDLKDALLNVDKASEDYDKGLKLLREDQKRLDEVNALTKKTVDALPGSYYALNAELVKTRKAYKELTPAERENVEVGGAMLKRIQELDRELKQMDADLGNYQRNVGHYQNALDGIRDKVSKFRLEWLAVGAVLAAGVKTLKGYFDTMRSNIQEFGDNWTFQVAGMKAAYQEFINTLYTGNGWSQLIANMKAAYDNGRKFARMLDEIFERNNSLRIAEADLSQEIEKSRIAARNSALSNEERLAAAENAIRKEAELAQMRKDVAAEEMEANKGLLMQKTKMTEEDVNYFINNYNLNRQAIREAQDFLEKEKDLTGKIASETQARNYARRAEYETTLDNLRNGLSAEAASILEITKKYNLSNDELVGKYVDSYVKFQSVNAQFERANARTLINRDRMLKEIAGDEVKTVNATADEVRKAWQSENEFYLLILKGRAKLTEEGSQEQLDALKAVREQEYVIEAERLTNSIKDEEQRAEALKLIEEAKNADIERYEREHVKSMLAIDLQLTAYRRDEYVPGSREYLAAQEEFMRQSLENIERLGREEGETEAAFQARRLAAQRAYHKAANENADAMIEEGYLNILNKSNSFLEGSIEQMSAQVEAAKYTLDNLYQQEGESYEQFVARKLEADKNYLNAKRALDDAESELTRNKLKIADYSFSTMLSLYEAFGEESAKESEAYKVTASAQALVQAYLSANEAYASMASIPYVGPVLGAVAAAAAVAQGLAQVRKINSTNMKGTNAPTADTSVQAPVSVSAPAVVQQVESTRTLTGVQEEQRINNAQRVYLVYDDVQQAGKKVSVEQSESTF